MSITRRQRLVHRNRIGDQLRALATYDVFPEFSAKVRRLLYNPLGVLTLAAVAALLCGLFLHPQGFVLFGGVLGVVLLGITWPWFSLRAVYGSLSFERSRASEGEKVEVCLTLRNRLPWSAWGLTVRDGFTRQVTANDTVSPVASIASVPRRRTVRCRWSFVPACRGIYPLLAPRLATGFPFGLWENTRPATIEAPLLVWPRTFPVGPVPLVSGDQQVEGNVSRNKVGSNGDVLGVRPYRRGDSPRRIHWGQSARHDRLIVCELQSNARPVVQLVLDADPRVHAGDGSDSSREWAVRIVASLAKGWLEAGAQVGTVWNGQVIPPASGQQQLHRLLDGLARLPDSPGPSLAETLTNPACRGFRDGLQVIVTTDSAPYRPRLAGETTPGKPGPIWAARQDQQRWVILRTAAFDSSPLTPRPSPLDCWLWIDSVERIPALLSGGWKERRNMAPELSRLVRQCTFALLVLAAAATEVAAVDARSVLTSVGMAVVWVGLAALLGWLVPLPPDGRRSPPRFVFLILLTLTVAPFVVEPLRRHWTGEGYPLELQMIFALRNLGLGLAAFAAWRLCLRLACVVSLFLMLFAVTMTDRRPVMVLLGLYTATGSVWLMLVYWTGLRRYFVACDTSVTLEVQPGERLPWLALFVAVGLIGSVLGLVAVGPQRAARVLGEWLPTSGGTGGYDPFARGGVNDGDDETRGNNPRSTGMVETDSFLDSPLPSLYDLFNDMYGEPFKPKECEIAIALDSQTKVNESKKPPADNLRPNRQFPTARKSPRQPRDPSDRAARAIFEVQGRTPLHVRVAAFDAFDGAAWQEAPFKKGISLLDKEPNSCWMKVREKKPPAIFAEAESHQLKITRSLGTLVPTPPHLTRFRVGRVDRADFFAWGQEGILGMAQRKTPAGIVVETECRTVDPRLLTTIEFPSSSLTPNPSPLGSEERKRLPSPPLRGRGVGGEGVYVGLPPNLNPEVAALAHRWADEHPQGWPQIATIIQHLRAEYAVDPTARVPDDCRDPLGHFLLHSHRGPDYQFASAAAVLARVLGYPTRLVSGFYASPDHYDPLTRHTPVVQEDLHFWAEVRLPSGDWLVIEPTPGYEVLGPNLPWSERVLASLFAVGAWLWEHLVAVSLCLAGLAVLGWKRRELFDACAAALLRLFPGSSWQRCVWRVLWLLERRGCWAGRPRPHSQTPSAWLRTVLPSRTDPLQQLTLMADWSAYGYDVAPPWPAAEVRSVCRRVLEEWTLHHWRMVVTGIVVRGE